MDRREITSPTTRLLDAIRLAQSNFILESSTAAAFRLLLDELLALTASEYGFIGELESGPDGESLRVRAYTDISWNEETRQLLRENATTGLVFDNLDTLFGHAIRTKQVVIANDAANDPRAGGIPAGHPTLSSFLGMPFFYGDQIIGLIGLANADGGYSQKVVDFLEPLISTCGILAHSRRLAEEQEANQYLRQEAERTQRLVEFSQKLSHDLNNLLTVTQTSIDTLMMMAPESSSTREEIDRIQLSTRSAVALTKKLLDYTGNMPVDRKIVSVVEIANEVVMLCTSVLPPNIDLRLHVADDLPSVLADGSALQRALTNMIFNSIEAFSGESGNIVVLARAVDAENVLVEVTDDGPGMDDATRQRAFDPYFSTKADDRGFGLPSVLGFAKSHAAQLELKTAVGDGTCIRLTLPTGDPFESSMSATEDFEFKGRSVLLVDDDVCVRESLVRLLDCAGADVVGADSADAALELMDARATFDLVITDVLMPGTDGFTLALELRRRIATLPILLISGHAEQPIPQRLSTDPKIAFLGKPFSLSELRRTCQAIC